MKERDPFTGSLFEHAPISNVTEATYAETSDEISRLLKAECQVHPDFRFCMVHMKWESNVSIYIDGKRPLFLCPAVAEQRGAWKWEGKWPENKRE